MKIFTFSNSVKHFLFEFTSSNSLLCFSQQGVQYKNDTNIQRALGPKQTGCDIVISRWLTVT